jgi:EpsI family protein
MTRTSGKHLMVGLALAATAALTLALTPRVKMAEGRAEADLGALVPAAFGEWSVDDTPVPVVQAPDVVAKLASVYSRTLARTYTDRSRRRVMLTLAYTGNDKEEIMRAHFPEVCYAAQGFQVGGGALGELHTVRGAVPVKRLVARKGTRNEPITYWITVGERATRTAVEQKLAQLRYTLSGRVPDGMLFRVSSVSDDEDGAFALQRDFVAALVEAVAAGDRARLFGQAIANAAPDRRAEGS